MPKTFSQWFKALMAAFVSGGVGSFLNVLGVTGANMAGLKVEQFTTKQLLDMTLIGGIVGAALYLKQSPVPQDTPTTTAPPANTTTSTTPPTQPKP